MLEQRDSQSQRIRDVAARIDDTFPHFQHLSSSSLPFQTWQRVDRAAGGTSINIAVDDGRAFSVGIKTDDANQTMPSLGEMLVIFGSPTCVIRDEASDSLTWGYENRSHQTILQFTVSQPSLWKPISSMLVGVSNLPIARNFWQNHGLIFAIRNFYLLKGLLMKQLLFLATLLLLLTVTSLAQAQDWMAVTPGGDAVCARGTPYTFFVRSGDPNKLLIFFEGGGACWNDATCAPNSGTFDEVVEGGEAANYTQGIFAPNPDNPLAGYTIVFVSYCTGDYHLGTKAVDYAGGTVQHKGYVDATAALNWTFATYKRPTDIVVAGCSAGAIGSIYYAPTVARHYRSAHLTQFGDAGVGVINPAWGGFDVWGVRNRRAPRRISTFRRFTAARRGVIRVTVSPSTPATTTTRRPTIT